MILSERLLLRELTIADAPFILELLNDSDFHRYIGDRGVRTLADAEHYIQQGPAVSYARHGHGLYLVARRGDEAKIGICGLIRRDTLPCEDIGYAFLPAYRGQGYGIEAAKAALQDGRERLGIVRVIAIVTPGNERSLTLLAKLGLVQSRLVKLSEDADACLLLEAAGAETSLA
ncbi:N-acetyltransferase [Aeromonas salmonicida]|uniref:N-acetyltransferase n=2 Tax=Gammaproteobacteria TaxID=1236 RepID=A0A3L0X8C8_ECOLX|nr:MULTISPECIES: GNAT family N-acetyltransferase [Aeromonas]ATP07598.1 GNAT family acetyltransferase [Aeromonas salmonicida subsp. pectinolytica 34mel]ATU96359.1 N-acetyltransferase [Aeromonas salmonicida]EQC04342.1 acetyltransferase [Aeromonas salmonicida subsp. pectinolytica 34mel]MBS2782497.1 GNAT family N-acetyltransferase [Aeromonas salmonicida]MDF2393879.1 GNAT family N-acetyltransferase [Aeromonas sp. 2MA4]